MSAVLGDIGLILLFVLVGGFFSASEMALVSLRESQLRALADRSERGARVASLAGDPNRFLSAVQIGVTFSGFLASAFGGATLAQRLAPTLHRWGLGTGWADTAALLVVTIAISYVSIVLGELVAKRIALQRAETVALAITPIVDRIALLSRPAIWFLGVSTDAVVRLLGGDPAVKRQEMTEQELRDVVLGHGGLGDEERHIVGEVFDAGDRQLREVMVPRTEVDFLDADTPVFKAAKAVAEAPHSRYPVVHDSPDDVVGFVHVRDLLDPAVVGRSVRVGDLARDVLMLPATKKVLPTMTELRRDRQHLAIVVDEYGGTAGIVTLEDLVEELVGDIRDEYDLASAPSSRRLLSGAVDVDGLLNVDDFADETGIELPDGPYETVAGFLVSALGHLPAVGETVETAGHTITVTELDGRRVARLRVEAVRRDADPAGESGRDGTGGPGGADGAAGAGGAGGPSRADRPRGAGEADAAGAAGPGLAAAPPPDGTEPYADATR